MPITDRQVSPEPRKPFSFRMPLAPTDYLDRSPLLTDEERRGRKRRLTSPADLMAVFGHCLVHASKA
jgi:hypothetical protein